MNFLDENGLITLWNCICEAFKKNSGNITVNNVKQDELQNISLTASNVGAIDASLKGVKNGIAELDENGKVPSSQLPSYKITQEDIANLDFPYLPLAGGTVTGVTTFSDTTSSTSVSTGAVKILGGLGVAGNIYGDKVYGSVWNDYAEYRETEEVEAGRVVYEKGDDTLGISTKRMMPVCSIVSDTFGFSIGKTEKCKTPLAIAGRVLAYPLEDRNSFKPGDAVCSGPNGTVSKMTNEEKIMYPECIIGYVSCVPQYENWNNNIPVNNRIWIKVK